MLCKLLGLKFSPGGLSQAVDHAADCLAGHYEILLYDIRGAPAVFTDETSWWVRGSRLVTMGLHHAERSLCPAVIARKISWGNKTDRGRHMWQILASLAARRCNPAN